MSKFACHCGNTISDSTYPSATEGFVIREQDQESLEEKVAQSIAAFISAVQNGKRDEWIGEFFPTLDPAGQDNASLIGDMITLLSAEKQLSLCECSQCGRLYVQKGYGLNSYQGYLPIEDGYAGILRPPLDPPNGENP